MKPWNVNLTAWDAVASAGKPIGITEATTPSVKAALAVGKVSLQNVLNRLVRSGHLETDGHQTLGMRKWWYGPRCHAPLGGRPYARHTPDSVTPHRQQIVESSWDDPLNRPPIIRPGATDHENCPSRRGDVLYYLDGTTAEA